MSKISQFSLDCATIKSLIHTILKLKRLYILILQGYKNDVCVRKRVVFEALKLDILRLLEPVSKTLLNLQAWQKNTENFSSTRKLSSVCRNEIKVLEKPLHLLNRNGSDTFHCSNIFKTASKILEQLQLTKKISQQSLKPEQLNWLQPLLENNMFKAISIILDPESCVLMLT